MNKKIVSWALYDWANSVFYTTVMAGFFPLFFKKYWSQNADVVLSTERLGYILSSAGFLLALVSPFLGVISDFKKSKKFFLMIFMICGVVSTASLYFVNSGDWFSAAFFFGFALFCCSASTVFNDALMVSVAQPHEYDQVSSLGYSLGYLGGGLLFIINVLMYQNPQFFGLKDGVEGVKVSFLTVAVWWFVFSLPQLIFVPEPQLFDVKNNLQNNWMKLFLKAYHELWQTLCEIFKNKNTVYFIVAYWFYIDGVATVMSMAVDFGVSVGFEASDLIKALLLTQFVGFPAAYLAGRLSKKLNNKVIISGCLLIYIFVVFAASLMSQAIHFYIMAVMIGVAQGGVQALSRSLFAQLIPTDKAGEYFGFFNLLGKFASVLGPLLMAFSSRLFLSPQKSILSLLVLFGCGLYFLSKVVVGKSEELGTPTVS